MVVVAGAEPYPLNLLDARRRGGALSAQLLVVFSKVLKTISSGTLAISRIGPKLDVELKVNSFSGIFVSNAFLADFFGFSAEAFWASFQDVRVHEFSRH